MRLNKQALVEQLMLQDIFANATKKAVTEFVEDFFGIIETNVVAGNEVAIPGFGKFEKFTRQNGVHTPKFRPAKAFKDKLVA